MSARHSNVVHGLGWRLAREDSGALLSIELLMMATIVSIGTIVGLTAFRDSLSQEFGDVSAGLASLNHGYSYDQIAKVDQLDQMRFDFSVLGSQYVDQSNFCEPANLDPDDAPPMCIGFSAALMLNEGEVPP